MIANLLWPDDFATSKGRNYHQGPEWLWPTGYFLRAMLKFDLQRKKTKEEKLETLLQINLRMDGCRKALYENAWAGLAELTNKNGEFCYDSVSLPTIRLVIVPKIADCISPITEPYTGVVSFMLN